MHLWRNGSAFDFGSKGCGFDPHGVLSFFRARTDLECSTGKSVSKLLFFPLYFISRTSGAMAAHLISAQKVVGSTPTGCLLFAFRLSPCKCSVMPQ